MAALSDYDHGRACGRNDYRAGRDYDPESGSPALRTGYSDGWSHAADEATVTHDHALACHLAWGDGVASYECRQRPAATARA